MCGANTTYNDVSNVRIFLLGWNISIDVYGYRCDEFIVTFTPALLCTTHATIVMSAPAAAARPLSNEELYEIDELCSELIEKFRGIGNLLKRDDPDYKQLLASRAQQLKGKPNINEPEPTRKWVKEALANLKESKKSQEAASVQRLESLTPVKSVEVLPPVVPNAKEAKRLHAVAVSRAYFTPDRENIGEVRKAMAKFHTGIDDIINLEARSVISGSLNIAELAKPTPPKYFGVPTYEAGSAAAEHAWWE